MKLKIITFLTLLLYGFSSCSDDKDHIGPDNPDGPFKKTVLLYMVAENNLSSAGYSNITNMLKGATGSNLKDNHVLVYFDPADDDPMFLQMRLNNYSEIVLDTIQRFDDQNSASIEVMNRIINLMAAYESDSYDLILWGHATNWLPTDYASKFRVQSSEQRNQVVEATNSPGLELYAYGDDSGRFLEIAELAEAIPDNLFDMILFDACYMGSVEVAYELRNKAKNFIAAASEIISYGFPYNRVMDYLLGSGSDRDYQMICQEYYDYYNSMSGQYQSATISWTRLDRMVVLASVVKEIIEHNIDIAENVDLSKIQNFSRYIPTFSNSIPVMFDLDQYIESIVATSGYEVFQSILKEVIPFERHTDMFINYRINRHCGLTIYPYYSYNYILNGDYENLEWYKAVYK